MKSMSTWLHQYILVSGTKQKQCPLKIMTIAAAMATKDATAAPDYSSVTQPYFAEETVLM